MAFVITITMSQPTTRYWALLFTLFCLPAYAQFDAALDSYRAARWGIVGEVPIYELPLKTGYRNYRLANPEAKQTAGKKRRHFSSRDAEDETLEQWVEEQIGKQVTTKRRKQSGRLIIFAYQVLHGRSWCQNCGVIIE